MPSTRSHDVQLQVRDVAVLRSLLESRVMTAAHICLLHFQGRKEMAKKRLQRLTAAGFVRRQAQRTFDPGIFTLGGRGFSALREQGILQSYPALAQSAWERRAQVSAITLKHELSVMDVKTALSCSLKEPDLALTEFTTWPVLNQFEVDGTVVKPDGFVRIVDSRNGGSDHPYTFFLELDRSTEAQDVLISRAAAYFNYYRSGGFAAYHGAPRSEFKNFPFRVLFVLKSEERRNNTAILLFQQSPPILSLVSLTTFREITSAPLGEIWIRPIDVRGALTQHRYGHLPAIGNDYRRQTARDDFVARNVRKSRLLD